MVNPTPKKYRIKAEYLNEDGCFASGGGVPDEQSPDISQMQIDPSFLAANPMQSPPPMPTSRSINPLAMMGAVSPQMPQAMPESAPMPPDMPQQQPQQMAMPQPSTSGIDLMKSGIYGEAATQGKIAREQADVMQQGLDQQAQMQQRQQQYQQQYTSERDAIVKQIQDNPVEANRLLQNQSGLGKAATAIGLILGGIGGGGKGNVAMDFLQKQISNDVDAQKANINSKQSLLADLERQYGNRTTAEHMLSSVLTANMASKIQMAALKSGDALAKNRADVVVGQLMATANAGTMAASAERSINDAIASGADMSQISPHMDEKQRLRAVPGFGLAMGSEGAKKLNEETIPAYKGAIDSLHQLQALGQKPFASLNPYDRTMASSLQTRIIGQMRQVLLGPGTISDSERALVKEVIADPTSLMTIGASGKLKSVEGMLDKDMAARAKQQGLTMPQRQQSPAAASSFGFKRK